MSTVSKPATQRRNGGDQNLFRITGTHFPPVAPYEQIWKAEYSVCISGREAFFSQLLFFVSFSFSFLSSSFCSSSSTFLDSPPGEAPSTSPSNCSLVSYLSWHFYRSSATVTQNAAFRPQMGLLHFPPNLRSISYNQPFVAHSAIFRMPLVGRWTVMFSDSLRLLWSEKRPWSHQTISLHTHTQTHTRTHSGSFTLGSPSSPLFSLF